MNRTDRLYALVEELRAVSPRRRSARWLAGRFEVSARTIERDIGALQQAGVPIYADVGRHGGYALDKAMTLPPLNFTPEEAVAVAVALGRLAGTPFERPGRGAAAKVVEAMSERDVRAARALAARVGFVERAGAPEAPAVPLAIERAIAARRVLRIGYVDRQGARTERDIEPDAFLSGFAGWYLCGWCRLRGERRTFRIDRIADATVTDLPVPPRPRPGPTEGLPADIVYRPVELPGAAGTGRSADLSGDLLEHRHNGVA